jgi:hypothetical protein
MKKFGKGASKEMGVKTPNCMAILAILGEMARRVNENISKSGFEAASAGS